MSDELPRDAHLCAALRHAPDRELTPPEALSREILAAARAAVAPPPWPRRVLAKATALLDLLRRPAAGAAFASLVLATVIGLMWRDGPPPEADAPPLRQAAPVENRADERPREMAPPAAEVPASIAAPAAAREAVPAPPTRKPAAPAPRHREAAAPPADARRAPPPPAAAAPVDAAAPRAEAAAAESGAGVGAMQKSAARPSRAAIDPLAPAIAALDLARDTTDAAALRSADGALAPRADPMRLWLADLQRSARGRWVAADIAPPEPATTLPGRDGAALGQLVIGADAAWWQAAAEPGAGWWRAPLPDADLQRLRAGLAAWSAAR
jgi:hypothetical protein